MSPPGAMPPHDETQTGRIPIVVLYSRPGCHLCDQMKIVVEEVGQEVEFRLEVIDISVDIELDRRYGREIPVLLVDGRFLAKYRVSAGEFLRALRGPVEQGGAAAD